MKKLFLLFVIISFTFIYAQDLVDIIAPLHSYEFDGNHYNSTYCYDYPIRASALNTGNPLGMAIGQATVASGQMIPEFNVNPANLAMTKYNIVQVSGLFNQYNGVNHNSLSGISYIVSVPAYRGSMTFGGGVNREKDYNLYYQNDDILQRTTGGLYNWRFVGAFEVQKDIFLGGEFSMLSGSRNNDITFKNAPVDETQGYIENNKYFGVSGKIGLNYHAFPVVNIGISIDLPTLLGVDYSLRDYSTTLGTVDYSIISPAVLRAGFAVTLKIIDFYYSFDYANWQNMTISSSDLLQSDQDELNREIVNNFTITQSHHFGMAVHVPMVPLHFYFGYQYLPDVYLGLNSFSAGNLIPHELIDRFRSSFSWGASFFLKQGISLTASFETYHVFYGGVEEKPKNTNLSLAYFF